MKRQYLDRMGIVVWRLREPAAPEKYFQAALNKAEKTVGLLLADVCNDISLEEQENLLQKIAGALITEPDKVARVLMTELDREPRVSAGEAYEELKFVIFLGNKIKTNFSCKIIRSFALNDLIKNPEYKKKLWVEIKSLRELLV